MKNTKDSQINRDAIVKRINRVLAKDGQKVKISRRGTLAALGKAYLIDTTRNNQVVGTHVDIIGLAQKLSVNILQVPSQVNAATASATA